MLGSLPIKRPLTPGQRIIFGGSAGKSKTSIRMARLFTWFAIMEAYRHLSKVRAEWFTIVCDRR